MDTFGSFKHTAGSTWGGAQISPFLYGFMTILLGFFGFDHLLLRSPRTAFAKFLVNIFGFGFWWIHDIVQYFAEWNDVEKYGLKLPFYGYTGLGAGIFYEAGNGPPDDDQRPNPLFFVLYCVLIMIPFGFANFIAGDFWGGTAMLLFTISGILAVFSIVWCLWSLIKVLYDTKAIFFEGTPRFFPATLFGLDETGAAGNVMEPKAYNEKKSNEGFIPLILGPIGAILNPIMQMLGIAKCQVEKTVVPAVKAASAAAALPAAAASAGSSLSAPPTPRAPMAPVATTLPVPTGTAVNIAGPRPATPAEPTLKPQKPIPAFSQPTGTAINKDGPRAATPGELALKPPRGKSLVGGGLPDIFDFFKDAPDSTEPSSTSSMIFFGTVAVILIGAVGLSAMRFWAVKKPVDENKQDDVPPTTSDDPPSGS